MRWRGGRPPVAAANERVRWLRLGRRLPGYGAGWVPGTSLGSHPRSHLTSSSYRTPMHMSPGFAVDPSSRNCWSGPAPDPLPSGLRGNLSQSGPDRFDPGRCFRSQRSGRRLSRDSDQSAPGLGETLRRVDTMAAPPGATKSWLISTGVRRACTLPPPPRPTPGVTPNLHTGARARPGGADLVRAGAQ